MRNVVFAFIMIFCLNTSLIAEGLIIVRVDANYAPYEMVSNGKLTGLHIDLVNTAANRLGIKIIYKSVPWKRAQKMVKTGDADAITYIGYTPAREKFLYFNDGNVLSSSNYGFIILKKRVGEISYNGDLRELKSYRIGVQRGYSYGYNFDKAKFLKLHTVKTVIQLVKLLEIGRVDLAVVDEPEYLLNRHKDNWSKISFLKPVITKQNFYIAFSKAKKLKMLTDQFAKKLNDLKQTKEYKRILTKYRLND